MKKQGKAVANLDRELRKAFILIGDELRLCLLCGSAVMGDRFKMAAHLTEEGCLSGLEARDKELRKDWRCMRKRRETGR